MEAIAHNPGFAKKVGVPQSVGKDFSNADKGKSFSKGGDMATSKMKMVKKDGKSVPAFAADGVGKMKKGGMALFEKSSKDVEKKGVKEGSQTDMAMDKKQIMGMKRGGMHPMPDGDMMKNSNKGAEMGRAVKRKTADVKGRAMKKGV